MSSDLPLRVFPFGSDQVTAVVTTRHGGVSTGPYGSLNLGGHVGDRPEAVAENRRRLAAALGVDRLTIADQKHTATVAVVDGALAGRGHDGVADSAAAFPGTDAMITNLPDVALTILVADCAPVVLYDPVRRAAGVAHSGRAGTLKGVIPQTIKAMAAAFGSAPADLLIGIGPAIGAASYEIGAAEAAEVMAAFGEAGTRLLTPTRPGRATFDLAAAIRRQLAAAAVPAGNVHDMAIDTRTGTDDFFSDRAARPCGRFAAIARLHRAADDSPVRAGASVLTRSPALTLLRCKLCARRKLCSRCKESARHCHARFFFPQYGIFLLYGVFTLIVTPQNGPQAPPVT